ncbi:hypothetical protein BST61_g5094 [Cercospora zeina]
MADWRQAAKDKAQSVLDLIPAEWRLPHIPSPEEQRDVTGVYIQRFLSEREIQITQSDALEIVNHAASGKWTAVEITKAFCHRAAIAHQLLNCLHEIFFDAAIAQAEALDQYYAQHKKPVGILHGLPISLKDQFHVKGVETHMGYVGWIGSFQGTKGTGKERNFESEMVKDFRSLGAVLYVKTSVPHSLMTGETVNNIIGYTFNSRNRLLSSGGSSGGEGTLIGARGSVVGFGTDIGGSIRIPAAFNGLYGLRPSSGRLPYQGMANSMDGQNSILSVVGPLATSAAGLKLVTQAVLSTKPWLHDPLTHEIPWRDDAELAVSDPIRRLSTKLSFAVMRHDGGCTPTPPVARAVDTAVQAMEKLGHQVIEWKPTPDHGKLAELCVQCYNFDGGADIFKDIDLSGEDIAEQVLVTRSQQANVLDLMATNIAKREAQKAYMDYWNSTAALTNTGRPVDAIICPVAPFPAARPKAYTYYNYTLWVNLLDYTSVVVPITNVDKNLDKKLEKFQAVHEVDQKTQDTYDPEIYDGAHVSIQLVGRRLQEEKMIALAQYVGDAVHGRA